MKNLRKKSEKIQIVSNIGSSLIVFVACDPRNLGQKFVLKYGPS